MYEKLLQKQREVRKEDKSTNELLVDDPRNLFFYPQTLWDRSAIHIRSFVSFLFLLFLLQIHIFSLVSLNVLWRRMKEDEEKGKQHKTIKSSRKKRNASRICFFFCCCEWDFFFFFGVKKEVRHSVREMESHNIWCIYLTKQVILWAFSSSRYTLVDPFLSQAQQFVTFLPFK